MTQLVRNQRCFLHADREAVARCGECTRYFCRECVTEHDGRLLCKDCLGAQTMADDTRAAAIFPALSGWLLALGSLTVLWLWFYGLGRLLARIPSQVPDWFIDL
ncbi:MAG: rhomboid family protein [Opitutales bacterium]